MDKRITADVMVKEDLMPLMKEEVPTGKADQRFAGSSTGIEKSKIRETVRYIVCVWPDRAGPGDDPKKMCGMLVC